jgi:hypothetical protein
MPKLGETKMTIDREGVRKRALAYDLLIEPRAIRERVIGGDGVFAQRVLLTALIKGSQKVRNRILADLSYEHFFSSVFELLFLWVSQELSSTGQADESALYEQMEAYVQEHWMSASDPSFDGSEYSAEEVMAGYLAPIDHVLAIDMPDAETIEYAIASLQKYYSQRPVGSAKRTASRTDEPS